MNDAMLPLAGPRSPRWQITLLNSEDRALRPMREVRGGSIEVDATTRLRGSGTLNLTEELLDIDWMRHRARITYNPGIPGVPAWEVATMLFTSPRLTHEEGTRVGLEVELLSKLAIIDEDSVEETFSLAAETEIIPTVVGLIESTGETNIAVTESEGTLSNPQTWEAGESKLTIINDLLEAAGYWALWVDGSGQFRVEPYQNPADRSDTWTFEEGEYALHTPNWSREQNLSGVPNRFVCIGQGTDEEPPLVGVALNEDPNSPFSFQARGRWITAKDEGVEVESQAVIDQLAQRRLLDQMSPVAKLDVTHAILPLLPSDAVSFATQRHTVRATIQRMSYSLDYDSQCQAEWREIIA